MALADYRQLTSNVPLIHSWVGEAISVVGDAFFNITVMWVVYTQSQSSFQTALVSAVAFVPDIVIGPFAGTVADRVDRKRILVITNFLAALLLFALIVVINVQGNLTTYAAMVAVFLLNTFTTFFKPARASLVPDLVGIDMLATASGLFSSIRESAALLGSFLAGYILTFVGKLWTIALDAISFLAIALILLLTRLPKRETSAVYSGSESSESLFASLRSGWHAMMNHPVLRDMLWLGALVNVSSFLGPLYPALVSERLGGGALAYAFLQGAFVVGSICGGLAAGFLERRLGAGYCLIAGWGTAGLMQAGLAFSPFLPLSMALAFFETFGLTVGGVSIGAALVALVDANLRGRTHGISTALYVLAIPLSTLIGGWLADWLGVTPMFVIGGGWTLGVAFLAFLSKNVRLVKLDSSNV